MNGLPNAFEIGEIKIRDQFSFDMPAIPSENDWQNLVSEFLFNSENFANNVEQMNNEKLDGTFFTEKYGTYLLNIEGVIEHSYYHLGQVSLIKKLITEK